MNRLATVLLTGAMMCARVTGATDEPFKILFVSTNGLHPGPVVLSGGTLYGPGLPSSSGGFLFKINTDGSNYAVLKTFQRRSSDGSYPDGSYPYGAVLVAGTTIYGTTTSGGRYGGGVAYQVNTDGTGFMLLHEFDHTNGSSPRGPLVLSGATLFGVTQDGGSNDVWGRGTVFTINTDGSDFRVLKGFCGVNCTGLSARPEGGIVLSGSTLYGTTTYDYANAVDVQCGSIFKINTDGSGYTVLKHLSSAEGRQPQTPLIVSGTTLYGAAPGGGASNKGIIFKINTDGTGFTVLKDFAGSPGDGDGPGYLLLSGARLFGATTRGGSAEFGTIFTLNLDGSGFTILKQFTDPPPRGYYPTVSAISGLTLFGSTYSAGFYDYGEVFSLTLSPPTITTNPRSQTAEAGAAVRFSANANGFPQPIYEWRFNETIPLACGSNSMLQLTNVQPIHRGAYTVIATNLLGAVTSAPAMLNVIPPVERTTVSAVSLTGANREAFHLEYTDAVSPGPDWLPLVAMTQADATEYFFDPTSPLVSQRFVRAASSVATSVAPVLKMCMAPAITVTGEPGSAVRLDWINAFGPTDTWVTLATVDLTNTSQLYFDISASGQPLRLYRVIAVP